MEKTRKVRGDAVLATLPEDRQGAIAEFGNAHSLDETVKWLAEDGIQIGRTAVSNFLSWYGLRQQLKRNESVVSGLMEDLKREQPGMTDEALQLAGQRFFSALAIEQQDAKSWKMAQDVRLKGEELLLARRKFQRDTCELFIKWCADKRAGEIANGSAATADKIERLGQLMFGEEWDDAGKGSRGGAEARS